MGYRYQKGTEPFYRTAAWVKVRQWVMSRDHGLCQHCLQGRHGSKRMRRAVLVHHIVPLMEAPERGLDENNLVSLCSQCHEREHARMDRAAQAEKNAPEGVRIIDI